MAQLANTSQEQEKPQAKVTTGAAAPEAPIALGGTSNQQVQGNSPQQSQQKKVDSGYKGSAMGERMGSLKKMVAASTKSDMAKNMTSGFEQKTADTGSQLEAAKANLAKSFQEQTVAKQQQSQLVQGAFAPQAAPQAPAAPPAQPQATPETTPVQAPEGQAPVAPVPQAPAAIPEAPVPPAPIDYVALANDPEKLAQFQAAREGTIGNVQQDLSQQQATAAELKRQGDLGQSEQGRFQMLRETFQKPEKAYGTGLQRLDQLVVQSKADQLGKLTELKGKAAEVGQQVAQAGSEGEAKQAELAAQAQALKEQTNMALYGTKEGPAGLTKNELGQTVYSGGALGSEEANLGGALAQARKDQATAMEGIKTKLEQGIALTDEDYAKIDSSGVKGFGEVKTEQYFDPETQTTKTRTVGDNSGLAELKKYIDKTSTISDKLEKGASNFNIQDAGILAENNPKLKEMAAKDPDMAKKMRSSYAIEKAQPVNNSFNIAGSDSARRIDPLISIAEGLGLGKREGGAVAMMDKGLATPVYEVAGSFDPRTGESTISSLEPNGDEIQPSSNGQFAESFQGQWVKRSDGSEYLRPTFNPRGTESLVIDPRTGNIMRLKSFDLKGVEAAQQAVSKGEIIPDPGERKSIAQEVGVAIQGEKSQDVLSRRTELGDMGISQAISYDPQDIQMQNAISADQLARYQALNKLAGAEGNIKLTPEQLKKNATMGRFTGLQGVLSKFHDKYGAV